MKSLYLDLFFFLNLSADYLICLSAGRICSLRLRRMRYLLASLLGAVYAALSVLPALAFLSAPCSWVCLPLGERPAPCAVC